MPRKSLLLALAFPCSVSRKHIGNRSRGWCWWSTAGVGHCYHSDCPYQEKVCLQSEKEIHAHQCHGNSTCVQDVSILEI